MKKILHSEPRLSWRDLTHNDARFVANMRDRLERIQPGTRILLGIYEARYLSDLAGTPMYKGRNATYVSFTPHLVEKWVAFAEQKLNEAVVSKLTPTLDEDQDVKA
jgi:hypothetical protein